jgi:hypothetical protein
MGPVGLMSGGVTGSVILPKIVAAPTSAILVEAAAGRD